MKIDINGKQFDIKPKPGEMLADLLRERMDLTGTKIGCSEDECGACTVLVDGEPVLSCTYPAVKAAGKTVLTIEGISKPSTSVDKENQDHDGLHPLQEAFVVYGAVQCGFCIPGQLMTAYALLQRNPAPTEVEIRQALKDTLCRCAGYPAIIGAIQAAAESLSTKKAIPQPSIPADSALGSLPMGGSTPQLAVVGTIQSRPDVVAKV
ncbi:(2Fe-2S)-binding protein, partial [Chloroflexota bacterium]